MVLTQDQKSESMITIIRTDVTMDDSSPLEKLNVTKNDFGQNGKIDPEKKLSNGFFEDGKNENKEALFDNLMEEIGNHGKFQTRFNFLYNFVLVTFATMPYLNIVLAMTVPEHWCHVPGRDATNFTVEEWKELTLPMETDAVTGKSSFSSCKMYNPNNTMDKSDVVVCQNGWDYDQQWYTRTAPSMENWVCDREIYVTNTFVVARIGEIIGTCVFGQLGDQIGRRPVFYISLVLIVLGRLLCAFSSGIYYLFLATVLLGNMATISVFQSPLVICMEVSAGDKRSQIAFLQCLAWVVGMCSLPMLAWLLGDWVLLMVISTAPAAAYLLMFKLLPESPRWLASRGRVQESAKVLKRIAKINGSVIPENTYDVLQKIADRKEKIYGIPSLFFHWRLAKNTSIIVLCWVICGLSYYCLVLNVTNMAGNPFMNFFWQSLVELPSYVAGRFLSNYFGRRWTQTAVYILATICCLIVCSIHHLQITFLITLFVALIKFCISTSFYMVWLQAIEIYPTCLRQTGTSFGGMATNIFGILGPYVVYLGTTVDARLPYAVMLVLTIFGAILSSFLPETLNQKLPETLEDAQAFGKDQKYWEFTINRKKK